MPDARPVPEATVILADSETCRDLFYATRFAVGDPILYFALHGRKYLVASDLEIGRALKEADVHGVLPLSRYTKRLKRRGVKTPLLPDVLAEILASRGVKRARVPHDFPVYAAEILRKAGVKVCPSMPPFFPERAVKTEREIAAICDAARATAVAIRRGVALLRRTKVRDGRLVLGGDALTSERLRAEIDVALLRAGLVAKDTIVAGGTQAADPHHRGTGPLRAHWPIVLDVFPRDGTTGYYADITRTVLRGRPSKRVSDMYGAVREAHAAAVAKIAAGVPAKEVHAAAADTLKAHGFVTGRAPGGGMQGFFHGTGHGLGLAVHEGPRVAAVDDPLPAGAVVTVEPGLYYPRLGGIRHEDDVVVREGGAENLVDLDLPFVV